MMVGANCDTKNILSVIKMIGNIKNGEIKVSPKRFEVRNR